MNTISYCWLSLVVSLATVTVLGSGFEAQSETIAPSGSTEVPTPGTTATQAALADQLAESASVISTSSKVAQATEPPNVRATIPKGASTVNGAKPISQVLTTKNK